MAIDFQNKITTPFASEGDKEAIPEESSDGTISQKEGFSAVYSQVDGKKVDRKHFNQVLYDTQSAIQELQTEVSDIDDDVSTLQSKVTILESEINNIDLSSVVTIEDSQTINGVKTFSNSIILSNSNGIGIGGENGVVLPFDDNERGIAIGDSASASGYNSIAIGDSASASGHNSIAIGDSASANNYYSTAIGDSSYSGNYSTAIGREANASNGYNTAIGREANASGTNSTAIGDGASARGVYSTAIGRLSNTSTDYSLRLGDSTLTSIISNVTSITSASDERDKADIETLEQEKALEFIKSLNSITYVNNPRAKYEYGEDTEKITKDLETIAKTFTFEEEKEETISAIQTLNITSTATETFKAHKRHKCKNHQLHCKFDLGLYDKEAHKRGDKKGSRRRVGFSAQQVQEAQAKVYGNTDNMALVNDNFIQKQEKGESIPEQLESQLGVNYTNFIPVIVSAMQEQQKQIETLQSKNETLKSQITEMLARLDKLEA